MADIISFAIMAIFAIIVLVFIYLLTVRAYWGIRFAVYRLVDFSRNFKRNK